MTDKRTIAETKKDLIIRLLKDGHITDEEFKILYDDVVRIPMQLVRDGHPVIRENYTEKSLINR